MTRFVDGPAAGVTLMLRRAPLYLRAVRDAKGEWDALDQLTDAAEPDETIVVYRREGEPTWCHVCRVKGGGVFRGGTYRVVDPQPDDRLVRYTTAWREWTVQHRAGTSDDGR